jgi:hypothetical protein
MIIYQRYSDEDVLAIANLEKSYHPAANLLDYYKLFFQANFGQGHFVMNTASAARFLETEMINAIEKPYYPFIQDISNGTHTFRVSLTCIVNRSLSPAQYLRKFLAGVSKPVDWVAWRVIWLSLSTFLQSAFPDIEDEFVSWKCLEAINDKTIISHSEVFRLTYHPHYRVMQLQDDLVNKLQKMEN